MPSKQHSQALPIIALLTAALFWGTVWYPLRWLAERGLDGLWATLIMFGVASLIGLPLLWRRRGWLLQRPLLLFTIALANGWCNTSFILAILDGTVVRVLLLFYLSPLWATLLGRVILGERLSRLAVTTVCLAIVGAAIILWDPNSGIPWPQTIPDWLAISSGFAFAVSNVFVRKGLDVPIVVKSVIAWVGVVALAIVLLCLAEVPRPTLTIEVSAVAISLGIFGIALVTVLLIYGVTHMPVHRSAVILLLEVLAGAISAQLLAQELIRTQEWIGGALVIIAAWLCARQHHGEQQPST